MCAQFGMILPLSVSFSTKRPFATLRKVMMVEKGFWLWSHFDRIPSALFGNEVRTRCTIALLLRSSQSRKFEAAASPLLRWNAEYRDHLFKNLHFSRFDFEISSGIPKVGSRVQADVLKGLLLASAPLALDIKRSIPFNDLAQAAPNFPQPAVYIGGTAYNWFPAWRDVPEQPTCGASLPSPHGQRDTNSRTKTAQTSFLLCSAVRWVFGGGPLHQSKPPASTAGGSDQAAAA
jgi:hypothetical protein